jgi:uncharacterized membrane protein YphA (DoxX/SURF4 family)
MISRETIGQDRIERLASLGLRFALGTSFLSAVVDRFGGWGPYGARLVSWGDFSHFVAYTETVNSFLPKILITPMAWIATVGEVLLGIALILGIYTRLTALLSGLLLAAFALAMSFSIGIKAPLSYSVFTASAAAFLLASVDRSPSRDSLRADKD